MRTREEQIADLENQFGEEGTFTFVDDRDAATKHILEAERRAEQRVRAEIEANLKDPATVHVNMLRGSIATPTWEQFLHLFPKEQAEIGRDSERLDWLEKTRSVVLEDADNGWCITIGGIEFSLREETARDAIDAAREMG